MSSATRPMVLGMTGLGGFAGGMSQVIEKLGETGSPPPVRLAAVCEPDQTTHAARIAELRAKGVPVFATLDELLAHPGIELVYLPLPIDLHRPFTEKTLAAGKPVLCEKPIAGSIDDADAMIAARDRAKAPALIGYQDIYDPTTLAAKRRLLAGDLGKVSHATLYACWPRNEQYYGRNPWAARFRRDGRWIMDSPPNNALAHYVNVSLFLLGQEEQASAQPAAVEAELYRLNRIENFDTNSLRITLEGGVTLLVLFTHACEQTIHPTITIHGAKGKLIRTNERVEVQAGGKADALPRSVEGLSGNMLDCVARFVRGERDDTRAVATLEVARAPLVAVNGASEATAVQDVPAGVERVIDFHGAPLHTIPGIEDAFVRCAERNQMLHESGLMGWSQPGGSKDLRGYRHFAGPLELRAAAARA